MDMREFLRPEAIRVVSSLSSKKRLFQHLAEIAAETRGLDESEVVSALQDREGLGPTALGGGVALPHARLSRLDSVAGAFIRLEEPIDFGAADRQRVDIAFALLAPEETGLAHLRTLASVARVLRQGDVCHKLRSNDDPVTLHAILTEGRATHAA